MSEKKSKERPEVLYGETRQRMTGCGKLYVTCNKTPKGSLNEVFVTMGKAGGCAVRPDE